MVLTTCVNALFVYTVCSVCPGGSFFEPQLIFKDGKEGGYSGFSHLDLGLPQLFMLLYLIYGLGLVIATLAGN